MANIVQQTIPLLKLPLDARKNVLQSMEILHLLGLSFCSKTALDLAASVNLKASCTILHISDASYFSIHFQQTQIFLDFRPKPNSADQPIPLSALESVKGGKIYGEDARWENFAHTARDLFQHIFAVFHLKRIRRVEFMNNMFEVESVKESFKGLEIAEIGIDDSIPNEYGREILSNFSNVQCFVIQRNPFEASTQAHKFHLQNLTSLRLDDTTSLTINDLLTANCSHITAISFKSWSGKKLNRWLKLWRSGCNPNLRCLEIQMVIGGVKDVLKGLNAQMIPEDQARVFEQYGLDFFGEVGIMHIQGGFDIRRLDGTCATISLLEIDDAFDFAFYVWS